MFFGNDDDGSDFLSPSGGSKLASLFGEDQAANQGGNATLTYSAPKEPKKVNKSAENDEGKATKVVSAAQVHAFKLIDSKYESQGKLGAALLANPAASDYKVLLYVSKQQQVTHARISPAFTFSVQKNNYATMYDEARTLWSLMFDGADKLQAFAKQVAIAKAGCQGDSVSECVTQELLPGDGGVLESGDSVEIKYTVHLFENKTIGQLLETSTEGERSTRFKLGRGRVIKAWEEGLLGARRGGRRFIICPPSHAHGSEGRGKIPPNAALAYDIEVIRVKLAKEKDGPEVTGDQPAAQPAPPEVTAPQSKQDEAKPEKPDKAKLMSRIAKMGQAMFPVASAQGGGEHEDSNDTERVQSPTKSPSPHTKPDIPTKPSHTATHTTATHPGSHPATQPSLPPETQALPTGVGGVYQQPIIQPQQPPYQSQLPVPMASQVALYQSPMQLPMQTPLGYPAPPPPPQYGAGIYAPPPQPYQVAAPPPPAASSAQTDVALTETRQHNTEFKSTLTKVADKVDRMYEKIEAQYKESLQLSQMPSMEAGVLLHNITRIVQDNERLKNELYDKNNKIEEQNGKINDLIQRNQRYIEQSNTMLEQRSDTFKLTATQSQDKVLSLEQDKVRLTSELSTTVSQVSALTMELTSLKKTELDMRTQLDSLLSSEKELRAELSSVRVRNAENEKSSEQYSSQLKDEKRMRKEAEVKLTALQEDLDETKKNYEETERNLTERKKKTLDERKKFDAEMEDMKSKLEGEIASLREKLKSQRSSTDVATAEQIQKLEQEMNAEWREKSERMVSAAQERHRRALEEAHEERRQLEEKIRALESRLSGLKTTRGESETRLVVLQEELEEARVWKDKYDSLRNQARAMKERYEARINELEQEAQRTSDSSDALLDKARQAQLLNQSQVVELKQQLAVKESELKVAEGAASKERMDSEVKKIMSQVYQVLKSKFKDESRYAGGTVHKAALDTVRSVTLTLLAGESISSLKSEPAESEDEIEADEGDAGEVAEDDLQSDNADDVTVSPDVTERLTRGFESPDSDTEFTTPPRSLSPLSPLSSLSPSSCVLPLPQGHNQQLAPKEGDDVTTERERGADDSSPLPQPTQQPPTQADEPLKIETADKVSDIRVETSAQERDLSHSNTGVQNGASHSEQHSAELEKAVETSESPVAASDRRVENESERSVDDEQGGDGESRESTEVNEDVSESRSSERRDDVTSGEEESEEESELFKSSRDHVTQAVREVAADPLVACPETPEGIGTSEPDTEMPEANTNAKEESAENPEVVTEIADDDSDDEDLFQPIQRKVTENPPGSQSKENDDDVTDQIQSPKESENLNQTFETANETIFSTKSDLDSTLADQTPTDAQPEVDPLFETVPVESTQGKGPAKEGPSKKSQSAGKSLFAEESKGLFDDDDDDDFDFVIKKNVTKTSKKKEEPPKAEESDEDDFKPKPPPPPLFGSDDDDDDLDWLK